MSLTHKEINPNTDKDHAVSSNFIIKVQDYLNEKYRFRVNALTMEIEFCHIENQKFRVLEDRQLNTIWLHLQKSGIKCNDTTLMKILNSDFTPLHHPVKDYFESLPEYDGKDYIKALADTIIIQDFEIGDIQLRDLWYLYLKKWLVGSASTCLGLGINQTCLILVGNQGSGKTTWLNKLCPKEMQDFLVCSHINPSLTDKNTANYLAEKWFVNIDDQLETIFGKDFNSMKAIITAPFVTNRKLFHRLSKTRPRICSFMGSVNSPRFLTDSENRRYLVFSTTHINYKHHIDMAMVWSQARYLAEQKYQYWFSHEEMKTLNKINDIYKQTTPEEEWLTRVYQPCKTNDVQATFLMPSEILSYLNGRSGMRLSMRKLSQAMEKQGFGQPISKRINAGVRKVYPVILLTEEMELEIQREIREDLLKKKYPEYKNLKLPLN